jgi:hypothetical protein
MVSSKFLRFETPIADNLLDLAYTIASRMLIAHGIFMNCAGE